MIAASFGCSSETNERDFRFLTCSPGTFLLLGLLHRPPGQANAVMKPLCPRYSFSASFGASYRSGSSVIWNWTLEFFDFKTLLGAIEQFLLCFVIKRWFHWWIHSNTAGRHSFRGMIGPRRIYLNLGRFKEILKPNLCWKRVGVAKGL